MSVLLTFAIVTHGRSFDVLLFKRFHVRVAASQRSFSMIKPSKATRGKEDSRSLWKLLACRSTNAHRVLLVDGLWGQIIVKQCDVRKDKPVLGQRHSSMVHVCMCSLLSSACTPAHECPLCWTSHFSLSLFAFTPISALHMFFDASIPLLPTSLLHLSLTSLQLLSLLLRCLLAHALVTKGTRHWPCQ